MSSFKELKKKIKIGMGLCVGGTIISSLGGVSDSVYTLVCAITGFIFIVFGFVIVMSNAKKLKQLKSECKET